MVKNSFDGVFNEFLIQYKPTNLCLLYFETNTNVLDNNYHTGSKDSELHESIICDKNENLLVQENSHIFANL